MKHKKIIFPEIDLSHDDGDKKWHDAGGEEMTPVYREDGTIRHWTWNGLPPGFWAGYWKTNIKGEWARLVRNYETNPDDVHHAWWYVDMHPVFWEFTKKRHEDYPEKHLANLEHEDAWRKGWPVITPHKVNPETMHVGKNRKKNTHIRWWYEFGPTDLSCVGCCKSHDYQLDGGGDTYEQCVLAVARKIHKYYGNDRSLVDAEGYWENRKIE
jgi:hypothetical protein